MYTNSSPSAATNADQQPTHRVIDVRSDTVSQPTPEMRAAMANAIVGDDVYGEDPTVSELERRSAQLFEKEAALFVPTGTMGNLLAVMTHCNVRGSEAFVGDLSHIFLYEQANSAHIAGVQLSLLPNKPDGTYCLEALARKIRSDDVHEPISRLAVIENTHNLCGGKVIPLAFLEDWSKLCRAHGISTHMDGARVFNAATHLGVPVARVARDVDSVCFCLSKGLSAPVGSVLVGSAAFIKQAHRLRKALGGGMRQAGILAAAGLCSLDQIVPILHHDHRHTLQIAEAIDALRSPWIRVDLPNVQSNILIVEFLSNHPAERRTPNDLVARLAQVLPDELSAGVCDVADGRRGIVVRMSSRDWKFARLVVYHQITDEAVDLLIKKLVYCVREWDAAGQPQ